MTADGAHAGVRQDERDLTGERDALLAYLAAQRASVQAVGAGLDECSLRRSVVPSGWTPLGLVEHLGHAERFWAQHVLAGRAGPLPWPDEWDPDGPFVSAHAVPAVFGFYRDQCARTDAVLAVLALDDQPPGLRSVLPVEVHDVRDVVLHLIEETARHAGHLDIARELLDGRTGLGPR